MMRGFAPASFWPGATGGRRFGDRLAAALAAGVLAIWSFQKSVRIEAEEIIRSADPSVAAGRSRLGP